MGLDAPLFILGWTSVLGAVSTGKLGSAPYQLIRPVMVRLLIFRRAIQFAVTNFFATDLQVP
jgi:hypothetical protein